MLSLVAITLNDDRILSIEINQVRQKIHHKTQDERVVVTTNVHICSSRQPLHGVFGGIKKELILIEEERLQNFWIEADALSGVSYFDVVNAGLEPVKYHYPVTSLPQILAQLNFKIWDRSKLCCYFRCLKTGDYFKLNLFFNAKTGGHYASQQGGIDFKSSGILGECFLLDIVMNEKGYPILKSARMIEEE